MCTLIFRQHWLYYFYTIGSQGPMWHDPVLSSQLTPTVYQVAIKPPLKWWGTAGPVDLGTVHWHAFQQFILLHPRLSITSHSDWARNWITRRARMREMKRTGASTSIQTAASCQMCESGCHSVCVLASWPIYLLALLRQVEPVFSVRGK